MGCLDFREGKAAQAKGVGPPDRVVEWAARVWDQAVSYTHLTLPTKRIV